MHQTKTLFMKSNITILKFGLFLLFIIGVSVIVYNTSDIDHKESAFGIFYIIFSIVFAVLSIILFFKIWDMTNDVSRIREILEKKENTDLSVETNDNKKEINLSNTKSNNKKETRHKQENITGWSTGLTKEEIDDAAPLIDLLNEGQLIVFYQGEMTICDMENFSHIEKECKIIYRK